MKGIEHLVTDIAVQKSLDAIDRQIDEENESVKKEVWDIDFNVVFDRSVGIAFGLAWIVFIILFIKAFARDIYVAGKNGALFDLNQYSMLKIVLILLAFIAVLLCTVYYIYCVCKPMPSVVRTTMYYKGKRYHYSEITKVVIGRRIRVAKVYIDGKYAFWLSPEYQNYQSFISWAKKCNVPIEGDTTIKTINANQLEAKTLKITIIVVSITVILILFFGILPIYLKQI